MIVVPPADIEDGTGGAGDEMRSTWKRDGNDWATIKSMTFGDTPASASCRKALLLSGNVARVSSIAASSAAGEIFLLASITSSRLNVLALSACASAAARPAVSPERSDASGGRSIVR